MLRPAFSSFFFHNAQWTRATVSSLALPAPTYRPVERLTPKVYAQLSKSGLTVLMALSAMTSVAVSPLPTTLPILLSTGLGTSLCSASANTLNQLQEVPFDAQMARTRNRPLVRRAISPLHASAFAVATGIAGPAILWTMVNPTTAILGASNIALYAVLYTRMKRTSIANTWVGSVVGGVPPLMGWTASGGHLLPATSSLPLFLPPFLTSIPPAPVDLSLVDNPLSPLALFLLLFSWQFPHFNPLAYLVRGSYAQAGYRMLAIVDPQKNGLVSLRHTLFLLPVCSILVPLSGLTTWAFALTSLAPNGLFVRAAWRFWRKGGEKEARFLFQTSLWYLPVTLGLMMFHKQGMDWLDWIAAKRNGEEDNEKKTMAVVHILDS